MVRCLIYLESQHYSDQLVLTNGLEWIITLAHRKEINEEILNDIL
jgi:hypothetical protein